MLHEVLELFEVHAGKARTVDIKCVREMAIWGQGTEGGDGGRGGGAGGCY